MGVLIGGESKVGSREDEGIGGDPVERGFKLDMIEVQNTATRISLHDYVVTTTNPDTIQKCTIGTHTQSQCRKLPLVHPHLIIPVGCSYIRTLTLLSQVQKLIPLYAPLMYKCIVVVSRNYYGYYFRRLLMII